MSFFPSLGEEAALDRLREGAVLVTVNQRLSRFFLHSYALREQELGRPVFSTPAIHPYFAWLRILLDATDPTLLQRQWIPLEPVQELTLWESVIGDSEQAVNLLRIPPAAQSAREAWALCCNWRIPWRELEASEHEDARAFTSWARSFAAECEAGSWLDPSRIPDRVIRLIREGLIHPPQEILFCGFDQYSPQQSDLFQALRQAGSKLQETDTSAKAGKTGIFSYPDRTEEITAAAVWARSELDKNPQQRVGIVAPNLSGIREKTDRIFRDVLHPEALGENPRQQLYNISLGNSLASFPLVQTGLRILALAQGILDWREASSLLLSPFLGGAETELSARAGLDTDLRKQRLTRIGLKDLLFACGGNPPRCPILYNRLVALWERLEELPSSQPPADWAASIQEIMEDAGWPGESSLDSPEHQCRRAWVEALQELASHNSVTPMISLQRATSLLRRILQDRTFQPEQEEAPIQILGVLEASGINLDKLWIMGMDEGSWPTPARPNPLLPLQLQRSHELPRCSPERELEFCRRVTRRLLASADSIRISYPRQEEDTQLMPSSLLPRMEEEEPKERDPGPKWEHMLDCLQSSETEIITDCSAPGVKSGSKAPGGTGLLQSQALCPFRAFAVHRLGAEQVEDPEIGLGPASRGKMVHTALHGLWQELGDQDSLLSRSRRELLDIAGRAASRAVREMRGSLPGPFSSRFASLEVERLQALLLEWLQVEMERPSFRVMSCERRQMLNLDGLRLQTVADRIDSLAGEGVAVIDYKTGEHQVGEWFRDRPGEPQLPLYCLASGEPVLAAAVARVSTGRCRFKGVTAQNAPLPDTTTLPLGEDSSHSGTWQGLLQQWEERLRALAGEIRQGYTPASPRDGERTCRGCGVASLCRILEHQGLLPEEEEE